MSFTRFNFVPNLRKYRRNNKLKFKVDLLTKNLKLRHLQTERQGYPYMYEWPRWLAKSKRKYSLRMR